MRNKYILWFDEVSKTDIPLVGGKGANLGEMTGAHFPIPYGFVVTAQAYFHFIEVSGIRGEMQAHLASLDHTDPESLHRVASRVQEIIMGAEVPSNLVDAIISHYDAIHSREKRKSTVLRALRSVYSPPLVAVRSSATAEDLPDASFAGQQETYLNVQGPADVVKHVKMCWASLFTDRAVFYRSERGYDHFKVGLAAVVQRMVQSQQSGIMFTVDPVSGEKQTIVIESIFGLGEYIVQGKVTPDHYEVSKKTLEITEKKVSKQEVSYIKRGKHNIEKKLGVEGRAQKISDEMIQRVAEVGRSIEKHYFFPQDIEWAIEEGELYIVQSRPITTLNTSKKGTVTITQDVFLQGDPASPGVATGTVVKLHSPKEIAHIHTGDVLVAQQTNPDYVPAMKRAAAIITERGGRTSHAAIVSRELGIPCVVGAQNAMKQLNDGDVVTVNGAEGKVYKGKVHIAHKAEEEKNYHTRTKIYLNVGEPDKVKDAALLPADGVGLLRAEFMIAGIGEHPNSMLKRGHGDVFTTELAKGISTVADAFFPRPVVYRATDFKTNEYRFLKGGAYFEPHEENPLIGYRGAYRYISDPDVFSLEVEAIKQVRKQGLTNVHFMLPFVRTPQHIAMVRKMVEGFGLSFSREFKLWMMVELPVNVILLDDFLDMGVDGVSVGSNDLTMLTLGLDRDNEHLSHLYDERNEAVLWAIKRTIQTCSKRGVTSSLCGQSVSDYPEMLEFLVKNGITSVSVSPDAFWRIKKEVHRLETHGHD